MQSLLFVDTPSSGCAGVSGTAEAASRRAVLVATSGRPRGRRSRLRRVSLVRRRGLPMQLSEGDVVRLLAFLGRTWARAMAYVSYTT